MLRKHLIVGIATIGVIGATVGGVFFLERPAASQTQQVARLPPATAEVTRTTLVETRVATGTLSFGEPTRISAVGEPGTGVITEMAAVGATVERGEAVFVVDDRPIPLLYGVIPFFRTLRFDGDNFDTFIWVELEDADADLREAELNFAAEQARLSNALAQLERIEVKLADAERSDPQTLEFQQLRGAVRLAETRLDRTQQLHQSNARTLAEVETAQEELTAARAAFEAKLNDLMQQEYSARLDVATANTALHEAERSLQRKEDALDALRSRTDIRIDVQQLEDNLVALGYQGSASEMVRAWQSDLGLPATGMIERGQAVFAPGPIRIAEHQAAAGDSISGGATEREPILDYTGVEKLVTVSLDISDHAYAVVGREVSITLPDRRRIEGVISEVGGAVTDQTIEVTVSIPEQDTIGTLEAATVDIEFVSQRREDVLAVPVTALLALPEGGFAVEVVEDNATRLVPVTTGLFAGGRVEINGDGVNEGMSVGVPG